MDQTLRNLPQIQTVLALPSIAGVVAHYSHAETVAALRAIIAGLRADMVSGLAVEMPEFGSAEFAKALTVRIEAARQASLRPVVNATGVIIHTNLGRAPLAPQAVSAVQQASAGASNLEFDLATGKRGSRHAHVEGLIRTLTGAEAAVVVNNCAAAVLLSLMVTAAGRSVVASRGELIEIGGSYRLPDVIVQSGAALREVGTTNKTRISDYEMAVDDTTAVLLKSHTSNFRIIGFTAAPSRKELAELARARDVILMEDLGSGVLIDLAPYGMGDEPVVSDILKAGVDLVMFSGDKLLGGPQAGIIAGRKDIIAKLKASPLMRAVRIDKLSLAALEATLRLYLPPHDPVADIPVLRMLAEPVAQVQRRAQDLAVALSPVAGLDVRLEDSIARVGAGAMPEHDLHSFALSVAHARLTPAQLTSALLRHSTPVVGRIERDRVLFDMRTVADGQVQTIAQALGQIADA